MTSSGSALDRLRAAGARTAVILGSGLGSAVPSMAAADTIAYSEFDEIPAGSVAGHSGRFLVSSIDGGPIIFAQGRVHLYEGLDARAVTAGVRVLAAAGVETLIFTNAAGSLNPSFSPGDWMMITDHINLTGTTPLLGNPDREPAAAEPVPANDSRFLDLTEAYSSRLRKRFTDAAAELGIVLHQGVYAGLLGPQYETPAEVKMLQKLGADAVGMSTVLEVIQARALGLEVAGFSCLTNLGAGLSAAPLSHAEVLETGRGAGNVFCRLLAKGLQTS